MQGFRENLLKTSGKISLKKGFLRNCLKKTRIHVILKKKGGDFLEYNTLYDDPPDRIYGNVPLYRRVSALFRLGLSEFSGCKEFRPSRQSSGSGHAACGDV